MQADTEYVYCSLPVCDKTRGPEPVYLDRETWEIIPNEEVEKIKDEFCILNPDKSIVFVQISIDDSPIKDPSE